MSWRFGDFELDPRAFELRRKGVPQPAEPQVLQLLELLVRERDRMVTRDEIIDIVWQGRIVSDSALSSRVKSARKLIGDDGKSQRLIKTIHGQGFRFVGDVEGAVRAEVADAGLPDIDPLPANPKPSIAVMPFRLIGVAGDYAGIAEALPADLIADLSRLRWLFVIARESSFQLRGEDVRSVGIRVGARYALTGMVEIVGKHVAMTVELADTRDGGVVWTDRLDGPVDAIHDMRRSLAAEIIGAIELQVPMHEAMKARLASPSNLDAWAHYHLGLMHLFRGERREIATARDSFERALALEPGFARAAAGLSSAHFMHAFVTRDAEAARHARRHAEDAMAHDALDPFANMAMGRALWLDDDLEASLGWLDRATTLNPNYAQAIYSRGWTETLLGDPDSGRERGEMSLKLSPLDPLAYAFVGVQAMSALVRGDYEEAADLSAQSARTPGAHALIQAIAALSNDLAGRDELAAHFAARARAMAPEATREGFLRSFPYRDAALRALIEERLEGRGF